jgi:arsenite methyltransferase
MNGKIRTIVRDRYGKIAAGAGGGCGAGDGHAGRGGGGCCGTPDSGCCQPAHGLSMMIGYNAEELSSVPEDANLGLGCGNPVALSAIQPGDTVLDLGSGAGLDCFLASRRVSPSGRVIGIDMTPEMIEKARSNADKGGYTNVEFRQGFIEALPVEDSSVDIVISNCVINLSPDKDRVFSEIHRVLKPGGQVFVSDIVLERRLPFFLRKSVLLYVGCVAGALVKSRYLESVRNAGLENIEILRENSYGITAFGNDPSLSLLVKLARLLPGTRRATESVRSIVLFASKARQSLGD